MQRLRELLAAIAIVAVSLLGVACEGGANVNLGDEGGDEGGEGGVEGEVEGEVGGEGEGEEEGDY